MFRDRKVYMITNPYERTTANIELSPKSGQEKRREKRKAQRNRK